MNAIGALATIAGKELFKNVVVNVYSYCKEEAGVALEKWKTERQIETLYKQISKVRKVKTIWQIDKSVDLGTFYCDSHVIVGKKRKKIVHLSDFGVKENILIEGIAGQGKSILLRYLCAKELGRGQFIPIFLELRRISKESSLWDRIETAFLSLGLKVDKKLFQTLASSGKILLLLDAFDEVPDELKSKVLTDIEDLSANNDNLRIVVTSRPYENIKVSNHFTVVKLDDLQASEYSQMIIKLSDGQAWAKGLIEHIENKAFHIKELLCTPLMVTLLVLSYKSYQKLPSKLSDFYDALFQTLLQRHDGSKPGFSRQRGCTLDDYEYRQAFETLCILIKKEGKQSLTFERICSVAKNALKECSFEASSSAFINDIVKITCLIICDGEEYRFIHKTVQEYYTSSFIQKKPDSWSKMFYTSILNNNSHKEWLQELEFLQEIDKFRFNKYFYLPALLEFLNISEEGTNYKVIDNFFDVIPKYFEEIRLSVYISDKLQMSWYSDKYMHTKFINNFITKINYQKIAKEYNTISSDCYETYEEALLHAKKCSIEYEIGKYYYLDHYNKVGGKIILLSKAIKNGEMPSIVKAVERAYKELFEEAKKIEKSLVKEENSSFLDGLI